MSAWADGSDFDFEAHNERVIKRNRRRRQMAALGLPSAVFGRRKPLSQSAAYRRWYIKRKAEALGITVEQAERMTPRRPYRPRRRKQGGSAVSRSSTFTTAGSIR